jgi:GTP cyclohydrolase I
MSTRGVHHKHVTTITTQFTGVFKSDADLRNRFLRLCGEKT